MKLATILFLSICFYGCLGIQERKTVQLYSSSKDESIKNGFFIDSLRLTPKSICEFNFTPISFWCEKAWKIENHLFSIERSKLQFSNYFLKYNNPSIKIIYKSKSEKTWQTAPKVIEPDLGYYLQIIDKSETDTIFLNIILNTDSCIYYFIKPIHVENE
ncbi:MAG: hypothetical protein IT269_07245 [Saprospiraceae bacterium]|nr:hypothetical protein [Saprospiraceae bacterium]